MKSIKILAVLLTLTIAAAAQQKKDSTQPQPKEYNIKLSEGEINGLYNILQFSKTALPTSGEKAIDVTNAIKSIEQLQAIIAKQYQAQAEPARKK